MGEYERRRWAISVMDSTPEININDRKMEFSFSSIDLINIFG